MANTDPPAPILVNATPTADQVIVGLRYLLLAVAAVASALGLSKVAGDASALLSAVGPLAMVIVFVWGQIATRRASQEKTIIANAAPDSVAQVRQS